MKKIFLILLIMISPQAWSLPLKGDPIPLPTDVLEEILIYREGNDPEGNDPRLYYVVPHKLTIEKSQFSSRRAYSWTPLSSGGALVQFLIRLNFGESAVNRAIRHLSQDTGKPVRFKTIEMRNPKLGGALDAPELIKDVNLSFQKASENTSVGLRFFMKVNLTPEGAEIWRDQIQNGVFFLTTSLQFEAKFQDEGGTPHWVPYDVAMSVSDLPPSGKVEDITQAIKTLATIRGEEYFFAQYANCQQYYDNATFRLPVDSEMNPDDPSMTAEEVRLYKETVLSSFQNARAFQENYCTAQVECLRGKNWMIDVFKSEGYGDRCERFAQLPPWDRYRNILQPGRDHFNNCAKKSYEDYRKKCENIIPVTQICEYRGDGLGDKRCPATLKSPTLACFPASSVSGFATIKNGVCEFNTFRWTTEFDDGRFEFSSVRTVRRPVAEALKEENCVEMDHAVEFSKFKGKIVCRGI